MSTTSSTSLASTASTKSVASTAEARAAALSSGASGATAPAKRPTHSPSPPAAPSPLVRGVSGSLLRSVWAAAQDDTSSDEDGDDDHDDDDAQKEQSASGADGSARATDDHDEEAAIGQLAVPGAAGAAAPVPIMSPRPLMPQLRGPPRRNAAVAVDDVNTLTSGQNPMGAGMSDGVIGIHGPGASTTSQQLNDFSSFTATETMLPPVPAPTPVAVPGTSDTPASAATVGAASAAAGSVVSPAATNVPRVTSADTRASMPLPGRGRPLTDTPTNSLVSGSEPSLSTTSKAAPAGGAINASAANRAAYGRSITPPALSAIGRGNKASSASFAFRRSSIGLGLGQGRSAPEADMKASSTGAINQIGVARARGRACALCRSFGGT